MDPAITLKQAAEVTGGRILSGQPGTELSRLTVDSRQVQTGDWFVALPGERQDGHLYAMAALKQGAGGIIVSRQVDGLPANANCLLVADSLAGLQKLATFHRSRLKVQIIGITGSNGKTTTKEMLAHVLAEAGHSVIATRGNMNSQIGLPLMLLDLESKHRFAVLEMGASEKGNIARLASLARPRYGVLTNVGLAHVGIFGGLQQVLEAKWELVESLPSDGVAVLNADDALLREKSRSLKASKILFGTAKDADVRAENVRQTPETMFDLTVGTAKKEVQLPLPGIFNVYNALAAASVAIFAGVPLADVARSLGRFSPPPQRMQVRRRMDGSIFVLDSYNANPSSMKASLESFVQAYPSRQKIAVLGPMRELGAFEEAEHRALGRQLAKFDLAGIYFLGKEGGWVKEAFSGEGGRSPFEVLEDREQLRTLLASAVNPRTSVLFKASRGVRLEEIFEPMLKS